MSRFVTKTGTAPILPSAQVAPFDQLYSYRASRITSEYPNMLPAIRKLEELKTPSPSADFDLLCRQAQEFATQRSVETRN
jgi:hypothetical protein